MSYDIEIPFDELGLEVEGGWQVGSYDGIATITIHEDGDWEVSSLAIQKRKLVDGNWVTRMHDLGVSGLAASFRYHDLCTAFENSYAERIREDVGAAQRKRSAYSNVSPIRANSAGRTL